MKRLLAVAAAMGFALSGSAAYATVLPTETGTFGGSGGFQTDVTPATESVSLGEFNPALGTLTQVAISVSYGFSSTLTISNNSGSSSSGSAQTESAAQFSSTSSAVNAILNNLINTTSASIASKTLNPAAIVLVSNASNYTLSGSGSTSPSVTARPQSVSVIDTNPADFASFEGLGNINFGITTLTGTLLSNTGGNTSASQVTTGNAVVSLTYTYAPPQVPEPGSIFIMASGLAALGFVSMRKRARG
jgi:hypothetical protein